MPVRNTVWPGDQPLGGDHYALDAVGGVILLLIPSLFLDEGVMWLTQQQAETPYVLSQRDC